LRISPIHILNLHVQRLAKLDILTPRCVLTSGKLYCHSELCDDLDILPDDIDDSEKFLPIPDKRELDLGKPLALDFARQFLPGDFDDVRQIFSRRGAYARFKNLLDRRGMLDQWHAFEAEAEESALKMWCEFNSIEVSD